MTASQHLTRLGEALSGQFTVYVPDRRGRGMSGPCAPNHRLGTEVEDFHALLQRTGAHNVFGLSAGAVIALQAALELPEVHKLALYEPPLSFDGVSHTGWVPRYVWELRRGRLASALVTVLKGTGDSALLRLAPRLVLVPLVGLMLKAEKGDEESTVPGKVLLRDLVPTMSHDARTVMEAAGSIERFAAVRRDVLLLGGANSAKNLKASLDRLSALFPKARRVTLPGVGHVAALDTGKPEWVAEQLRAFFLS